MFLQNFTNPGFSSEWLAEVEQYFFQEPLEINFCNKNKIFEVVAYLEGKILDISKFLLVAVTKIKTNVNESSNTPPPFCTALPEIEQKTIAHLITIYLRAGLGILI